MPVLAQSQTTVDMSPSADGLSPVVVTAQSQQAQQGFGSDPGFAGSSIDQISEIIVQAARSGSLGGTRIDFNIPYPQEQLWAIYPGNQISYLGSGNGHAKGNVGENRVRVLPGFTAIAHTHPKWAYSAPGPEDWGKPYPLYGITPSGVWVIAPGATSATCLYGNCGP
jgi:hypothetical protein